MTSSTFLTFSSHCRRLEQRSLTCRNSRCFTSVTKSYNTPFISVVSSITSTIGNGMNVCHRNMFRPISSGTGVSMKSFRHSILFCNHRLYRHQVTKKILCTDHVHQQSYTQQYYQQQRYMSSVLFTPSPPDKLTTTMAAGIADATQFYIRYGISNQRLKAIANYGSGTPLLQRWQEMMEIFLTTQVHVVAGMGYASSEEGLTMYAEHLAECVYNADETMQELLREVRRDTWREIVAIAFNLNVDTMPTLSIVDARNIMHKVASKMIEPNILYEIHENASHVTDPKPEMEIAKQHHILQDIIINRVYLGGNPSIVHEAKEIMFNTDTDTNDDSSSAIAITDESAYAMLQCCMSDHEADPLIAQYANSAMTKKWAAAGLDLNSFSGPASSAL